MLGRNFLDDSVMEIEQLREKLKEVEKEFAGDPEVVHAEHDKLLLEYIDDKEVTAIFEMSEKWYA